MCYGILLRVFLETRNEGGMIGRGKKCLQFVHQFDLLSEKELVSVARNLLCYFFLQRKIPNFFKTTQMG